MIVYRFFTLLTGCLVNSLWLCDTVRLSMLQDCWRLRQSCFRIIPGQPLNRRSGALLQLNQPPGHHNRREEWVVLGSGQIDLPRNGAFLDPLTTILEALAAKHP